MIYALRNLCIENNWFTGGSNDQYGKLFKIADNGATIHELAIIIWLCSADTKLSDIEYKLNDLLK